MKYLVAFLLLVTLSLTLSTLNETPDKDSYCRATPLKNSVSIHDMDSKNGLVIGILVEDAEIQIRALTGTNWYIVGPYNYGFVEAEKVETLGDCRLINLNKPGVPEVDASQSPLNAGSFLLT